MTRVYSFSCLVSSVALFCSRQAVGGVKLPVAASQRTFAKSPRESPPVLERPQRWFFRTVCLVRSGRGNADAADAGRDRPEQWPTGVVPRGAGVAPVRLMRNGGSDVPPR